MNKIGEISNIADERRIKIADGTQWANPMFDSEWYLRYGSEEQIIKERMYHAEIVSAYRSLVMDYTPRDRNRKCRMIKDELERE